MKLFVRSENFLIVIPANSEVFHEEDQLFAKLRKLHFKKHHHFSARSSNFVGFFIYTRVQLRLQNYKLFEKQTNPFRVIMFMIYI